MFCFIPFSSIITVGGIAWKKPSMNPSLLWNGKRECTFPSHEEQKNFFGQSWHLISVFPSKHIWQWSGEGRLSQLSRTSSSSFRLLSQLDDKFTILVSQFLDGIFVELRNSSHLAKAASILSVEQYSYLYQLHLRYIRKYIIIIIITTIIIVVIVVVVIIIIIYKENRNVLRTTDFSCTNRRDF